MREAKLHETHASSKWQATRNLIANGIQQTVKPQYWLLDKNRFTLDISLQGVYFHAESLPPPVLKLI